jgi:DNA-binding NarL/FixJ family response regulator
MRTSSPIKIVIADDHPVVRLGLEAMLRGQPDMRIVAQAADGEEAVRQALLTRPDVVLLDVLMPVKGGLEALVEIARSLPGARCLMLTTAEESDQLLQALRFGAMGFLLKDASTAELLRAIRTVYHTGSALDPAATRQLLRAAQARLASGRAGAHLTRTERAVIRLLSRGLSNRQLADELEVSERTIATHIQHILDKLALKNRAQAALYARTHGLTA